MNVYLCLTSINGRQNSLFKTLKSIIPQKREFSKCYIYLSEEPYLLDTGFQGKSIGKRKLEKFLNKNKGIIEVRWCENIGPYRKLLPLIQDKINEDCLIITVDDDTMYDINLVSSYKKDFEKHQCCISYRGFTFDTCDERRLEYSSRVHTKERYLYNFHTGKGGVAYHPSFFRKTLSVLLDKGIFLQTCKTNDDIWFNVLRIVNEVDCVVKNNRFMNKEVHIAYSLYNKFNASRNNTVMIRNTFAAVRAALATRYPAIGRVGRGNCI